MAKEFAKSFYKSKEWTKCRNAFFKYKNGLCERCLDVGKIVHHKIYITPENINNPEITLNWDNLEVLCDSCHIQEHTNANNFYFDCEGNIIYTPQSCKK